MSTQLTILKSQINAIKAITKIEEGFAAKEAALSDTQDLAEELLYAEARLGGMLEKQDRSSRRRTPDGKVHGQETLPPGIDKKQSHYAQQEIAEELWIAREMLSSRYHRDGANAPSWNQYCIDIGTTKSTVNRWLYVMF